jgi:predicted transcriptional regulator
MKIIEDILLTADESNGALKSHLILGANLNFKRVGKYLKVLISSKMVEPVEGKTTRYYVTPKGREFLKLMKETKTFM